MFKVCIIGCGMITNNAHVPAYRTFSEDYYICAVSDANPVAAEDTAKRHGIPRFYTSAEEMLRVEKPDVVSVCVPNCLHKAYTELALNADASVLCEKPLAVTKKDAEELFALAKEKGKILMACQSMRFTPDRLAAKRYLEESGNPEIYYGELSRVRTRGIPYWGRFHIKEFSLGGAFLDIGVHMLDALVWLMGNPKIKEVRSSLSQNHKYELGTALGSGALTGRVDLARPFDPEEMDVEDFAEGTLIFEGGAKISIKVAWAANMPECSDIRLIGKKAGLYLPEGRVYTGADAPLELEKEPLLYDMAFPGHAYLADNLRRALRGEAEPAVKPEESINVAHIIELFYKAAEQLEP